MKSRTASALAFSLPATCRGSPFPAKTPVPRLAIPDGSLRRPCNFEIFQLRVKVSHVRSAPRRAHSIFCSAIRFEIGKPHNVSISPTPPPLAGQLLPLAGNLGNWNQMKPSTQPYDPSASVSLDFCALFVHILSEEFIRQSFVNPVHRIHGSGSFLDWVSCCKQMTEAKQTLYMVFEWCDDLLSLQGEFIPKCWPGNLFVRAVGVLIRISCQIPTIQLVLGVLVLTVLGVPNER